MAEMLRVDHAGELGAVHIYRGQRAVIQGSASRQRLSERLADVEAQEAAHLSRFDTLLTELKNEELKTLEKKRGRA